MEAVNKRQYLDEMRRRVEFLVAAIRRYDGMVAGQRRDDAWDLVLEAVEELRL